MQNVIFPVSLRWRLDAAFSRVIRVTSDPYHVFPILRQLNIFSKNVCRFGVSFIQIRHLISDASHYFCPFIRFIDAPRKKLISFYIYFQKNSSPERDSDKQQLSSVSQSVTPRIFNSFYFRSEKPPRSLRFLGAIRKEKLTGKTRNIIRKFFDFKIFIPSQA